MSAARDPSAENAAWDELHLEPRHRDELKRSAISARVAADRPYRTITTQAALAKEGFGRTQQQCVPGYLIPSFNIAQQRNYPTYKPDEPRLINGKPAKYERPAKSTSQLDIPKRAHQWAVDPQMSFVFVESPKSADCLATHEICGGAIGGSWNWRGDDIIASLDQLHLKLRNVYLGPDSDWRRNPQVRKGWLQLGKVLVQRGAVVRLIAIPDAPDGKKQGPDDWFYNGGDHIRIWSLSEEIEELESVSSDEAYRIFVRKAIPGAPVLDTAVVPFGYELSATGIEHDGKSISSAPLVVTARLVDVEDHSESLRLAWWRDGRWREQVVSRGVVANARDLVGLAEKGLSITSRTMGDLVDYLADYEAQNLTEMPRARVSSRFGWQGKIGEFGFLVGRNLIRADGTEAGEINLDELSPSDWREDWVAFHGSDEGNAQAADAFVPNGSHDDWMRAVKAVSGYPKAMLALYASFATPLLSILNAQNFGVDWCYPTSTGKTTALRLGGSVWGNPNENSPASVVRGWSATRVYIERMSAALNGLPLILDDTKKARFPKDVAQTIYDVVSGQGKGRGSVQGIRRSGSWSTILLSSGEAPATSFTEDGGTRARILTMWGLPFSHADGTTAPVVLKLNHALQHNYGHAGPRLVRHLLTRRDDWDSWRSEYHDIQASYLDRAGDDPVAGRLAGYFAILDMASLLAHDALDLPWEYKAPIEDLWVDLIHEASSADRAKDALAMVYSWAHSRQHDFEGRFQTDDKYGVKIPIQGVLGKWDRGDSWESLAIYPHLLKSQLDAAGFDSDAIIRTWRDRDWLELDSDKKHFTKQVRINGEKTRAIVVKRSAIEARSES